MNANPFFIEGPAAIHFSGGRTSGRMLRGILDAHGGRLPDDALVVFANTGLERPETLRFVHELSTRWGVPVRWIEWRPGPKRDEPSFEEVGFNSACRDGSIFEDLIARKGTLPNGWLRWCTTFLKVLNVQAFIRAELGLEPGAYLEAVGLRDDEGERILTGMERAEREGRKVTYPLARAGIVKDDIWAFWLGANRDPKALTHPLPQGFDLGLWPWEGNCTLCFQKGRGIRKAMIRQDPTVAEPWLRMEQQQGSTFDKRDSVAGLVAEVRQSPGLFDELDSYDVECGPTSCAGEPA